MKAVATAFVLIAGAAVVLWLGNTLNSLLLAGLIGGLVALLVSIPISLTLFSYFTRRHQENHVSTLEETERAHYEASMLVYEHSISEIDEEYEEEEASYYDERDEYGSRRTRGSQAAWEDEQVYLDTPLPPAGYLPAPTTNRGQLMSRLPETEYDLYEEELRQQAMRSQRGATTRRPTPPQGMIPVTDPRSQYRSHALHTARQEAIKRARNERDYSSAPLPRRQNTRNRPAYSFSNDQNNDLYESKSTYGYTGRPRQIIDESPPRSKRRTPASLRNEQKMPPEYEWYNEDEDPQVHRPLVRRAPYTSDDERQGLARNVEPPLVRRTSRNLRRRNDDRRP